MAKIVIGGAVTKNVKRVYITETIVKVILLQGQMLAQNQDLMFLN